MRRGALHLLGGLAALAACARPASSRQTLHVGQRLVEGAGQDLIPAPAGGAATYLREPRHPEGPLMPPDAFLGELLLVTPDGKMRSLGTGATNLAGSVLFSPDGRRVAYLSHFDFASHTGDLSLAEVAGGEPRLLAAKSSFFGFSPDGRSLAYVALGRLSLLDLDRGAITALAQDVATFEFSADGRGLLYRQRAANGADLVLAPVGPGHATTVARQVADYQFDRKGEAIAYTLETPDRLPELHLWKAGSERLLGTGTPSFAFSPDGKALAFVAGVSAAYLEGDTYVVAVDGGAPQRIGRRAGSYVFSPDGSQLAFLHDYYDRSRTGKLAAWRPKGGITEIADFVRLFGWSHRGGDLAWLRTVSRPLYTEQLHLAAASNLAASRFIGQAIYSFDFSPDDRELLFKTGCVSGGNACDLMEVPTDPSLAKTGPRQPDGGVLPEKATRVAAGISDYDYSPDDRWLWLTFVNPTGHTVDVAVIPSGEWSLPRYVDRGAEPHPRWLPTGKVAYLVNTPKRPGLYEADPAQAAALSGR
ncbi:MAG: TolB family protein [Myxococcales bacterium]